MSSRLISFLRKIADQSAPAVFLLDAYEGSFGKKELKGEIDYLDLANDKNMITYMTSAKIKKLSISSYEEALWYGDKGRRPTKPAQIFSKLFNPEFIKYYLSDSAIEQFHNLWFSIINETNDFKIVNSKQLLKYYLQDSYPVNNQSTLWKSCMREPNKQKFLHLYSMNPDVCSLLVKLENSKVIGRAILWNFVNPLNGEELKILDRIYYYYEWIEETFKDWARKNDALHKARQRPDDATLIKPDGSIYNSQIQIPLQNVDFPQYPYMDTFKYLDLDKKLLTIKKELFTGRVRTMGQQDGNFIDETWDIIAGKFIPSSQAIKIDLDSEGNLLSDVQYTSSSSVVEIHHPKYKNKNILKKHAIKIVSGEWILKKDAIMSNIENGYISKNKAVFSPYLKDYLLKENMVNFENQVTHRKYVVYSARMEKYIIKSSDIVKLFDHDYLPLSDVVKINRFYFPKDEMIEEEIEDRIMLVHKDHIETVGNKKRIISKAQYFYIAGKDYVNECDKFFTIA